MAKKQRGKPKLEAFFERREPFGFPDTPDEIAANSFLEKFHAAPFKEKLFYLYRWKQSAARAIFGTTDVSDIATEDLKIISNLSSDDPHNTKYADKIKSPTTGIRAFCVNCQGGQISWVRNCTNAVCPLFPFRMGSNAFSGRLADAEIEATEDYEEEENADQEA